MEGAFVNERHPYAARGSWLQVLISDDMARSLIQDLEELSGDDAVSVPADAHLTGEGDEPLVDSRE